MTLPHGTQLPPAVSHGSRQSSPRRGPNKQRCQKPEPKLEKLWSGKHKKSLSDQSILPVLSSSIEVGLLPATTVDDTLGVKDKARPTSAATKVQQMEQATPVDLPKGREKVEPTPEVRLVQAEDRGAPMESVPEQSMQHGLALHH